MSARALVVVEARGQAIHLREDASLNLMQAGHLAGLLAAQGVEPHLRLVIDAGQSVEEYSVLYHRSDDELAAIRRGIRLAPDRRAARRDAIRELRERWLPYVLAADDARAGCAVAGELFFAALAGVVAEENPAALAALLALAGTSAGHPAIDLSRLPAWRELLAAHRGRPVLELEEAVARRALARWQGAIASIEVLTRVAGEPAAWLADPRFSALVEEEIGARESHGGRELDGRLLGFFPPVADPLTGRDYFNSPTSVRCEHGKVRVGPRDRFDLLSFEGSERWTFADLRARVERQRAGAVERPFTPKYPLAARRLAEEAGEEAARFAQDGPTAMIFVEGVVGRVNPATGGLVDRLLREQTPPGCPYFRYAASAEARETLPDVPGGLPLIEGYLAAHIEEVFVPDLDVEAILATLGRPALVGARG
ncbi:MAG TPA: hypothetical protein VN783_01615 [Thermoanaerobaculia bacterium]|nr:hypothetical protein [Thermoanaerobaculia bacterium]